LDEVLAIAKEVNKTPGQVALNWMLQKPVTATLFGARKLSQLEVIDSILDFRSKFFEGKFGSH
jgi:aryl-alcohol dehydrogenase-like predicted oxidoreductase